MIYSSKSQHPVIIFEDDFLKFKIGVECTFNFAIYFFWKGFGHNGPWTNNKNKNLINFGLQC
jgi:hypothetical protein